MGSTSAAAKESWEIRLIKRAVTQALEGSVRDYALDYLDGLAELVDANALLLTRCAEAKRRYEREVEEARRKAKARARRLERVRRRQRLLAEGGLLAADGAPILFGQVLYGRDGRGWRVVGVSDKRAYDVCGTRDEPSSPAGKINCPLKREWLTHLSPVSDGNGGM